MQIEINQKLPIYYKIVMFLKSTSIFGLFFAILGAFISSLFLQNLDIIEIIKLNSNLKETKGIISEINETDLSVNESVILEYEYLYSVKDEYYKWKSYNKYTSLNIGDSITIQYNIENPEYSVIKNYNYLKGGIGSLFILIFPIIGLTLLFFNIFKTIKQLNIIHYGILTYGVFFKKEATLVSINDERQYKLHFEFFNNQNVKHILKLKTHKTKRLEDDEKELIIYSKNNINKALLVDDLPKIVSNYIKKNWV